MKKLKLNRIKCLNCGEILVSTYRHDFKMCDCENKTSIDGGNVYQRVGGVDLDLVEDLSIWEDDDVELLPNTPMFQAEQEFKRDECLANACNLGLFETRDVKPISVDIEFVRDIFKD